MEISEKEVQQLILENQKMKKKLELLETVERRYKGTDAYLEDFIDGSNPKKFLSINGHILTQEELRGVSELFSNMRKLKEM